MPELPEVETIARRLQPLLPGKNVTQVSVHKQKSFHGELEELIGSEVVRVHRRAKILGFELNDGSYLATHLKMTGQLIYVDDHSKVGGGHPTADWVQELPSSHTRITYQLSDNATLYFNDQRLFGWMKHLSEPEYMDLFSSWGPDINDPAVTTEYLYQQLQRRTIAIKQAIMDNKIVCGVGNIYACDSLNVAQISPLRSAKTLSKQEVTTLLEAMKTVIERGIELGGTTFDGKYLDIDGFAGGYQDELRVYGREGEACPNCKTLIEKIKIAGRGTYCCPGCQT